MTELTQGQIEAIEIVRLWWIRVGDPQPTIGRDGAIMIECFYESGHSMWVIIERGGHIHS